MDVNTPLLVLSLSQIQFLMRKYYCPVDQTCIFSISWILMSSICSSVCAHVDQVLYVYSIIIVDTTMGERKKITLLSNSLQVPSLFEESTEVHDLCCRNRYNQQPFNSIPSR
jgi:hypothetical protein